MVDEAVETRRRAGRAGRLASSGAIRDAAAALFLEKGYRDTSMDDIAAAAQVSKQTIYTHFANKQELFEDLVLGNVDRVDAFLERLNVGEDLAGDLSRIARDYVTFVARPDVIRLRRLVIAEASRFPELARTYYDRVPARVVAAFAALFQKLTEEGRLNAIDPETAAQHFVWLVLGVPLDRGMFLAVPAADDLGSIADSAVRTFLAAYR
ncbi:MAG TPA: TetR/AcrR family transcriptional regulator [Candidatus Dormibacteraeota bacterium]|nr:TetR/AcrR family transcriptional regulator [Candidatus Dormibacteraeota bacterium]